MEDTKAGERNKSIIEQGGREAGVEGKRREKGDRGRESWEEEELK